ncbi:hypothetical protein FCM35_KLT18868 [Carex littledalei]|uniref:RRM domain-containing protein n=1 Tax=Carex littledalei TaxID=544730 RepID=A0A833VEC4_9POAL|nr:hypothetical protein FCM35_KLT18868 [Carex littledalei]
MNRMIVASKQAIRITFSHGENEISRILCIHTCIVLHTEKTQYNNKHGAMPLVDELRRSINQERELHEHKDISVDDEFDELGPTVTLSPKTQKERKSFDSSIKSNFEELGPTVASSPKTNFRSFLEVPQKERKSFDSSIKSDFEELGPTVTSSPKSNFTSLLEFFQKEKKNFGKDGSNGNEDVPIMNNKGKDGNVKIGFGTADLVSVAIDKVPISVNSGQLTDAMRAFGEVKSALSVTSGNNGLGRYHVEFKNRESKKRALRAEAVTIGSNILRINDIKTPRLLRIRIDKVDSAMSELAIHSKFSSYGHVTGLISTNDGEIDVFFQVDGEIEAERLVNKLDKKWTREVELLQPKTTVNTSEKSELHIERMLGEMRKRLELQRIYLEDLEHLHSAISHIKANPYSINNNS